MQQKAASQPHDHATAWRLEDGTILIAGGYSGIGRAVAIAIAIAAAAV